MNDPLALDTQTSAADTAYAQLRRDILDDTLPPGQRLTEQSLAARLGISRTPVRAAVARLVQEGFVERGEGYSTRVAQFDTDDVAHVFEMRARLEGYAARQAASNASQAAKAELHRLADIMSARTPPENERDYSIISDANEAFHRTIYQAAGSPRIQVVLAAVVQVAVVARTYRTYRTRDLIRSAQHHQDIADAISAGAADWADHAMTSHVLAALAALQETRKALGGNARKLGEAAA